MKIVLDEYEMAFVRMLAQMRQLVNVANGIKERKMGDGDAFEYNVDGVMSEYAFCKWKNVFFDCSSKSRSGGYDCIMPSGLRIDIKSKRTNLPGLNVPAKQKTDVDMFILCYIEGNTIDFTHYCKASDIYDENFKKDWWGKGVCYYLAANQLYPIK